MGRVRRGNLPAELNSFVGRRRELARLRRSLETHRAVTVTGTGGVGKSRLARRAAAELGGAFVDGVWLVDLSDAADGHVLASVVAAGLGLRDDGGTPVLDRLVNHVRSQQMLLLLDGCDRVVDAAATLAHDLLRTAPGLKILVTSRRALHVDGEAVMPLGPLEVPDSDDDVSAASLPYYDAPALLIDRATAVNPDFVVSDEASATLLRICRRLDALPLAIEFAADRLDVLSIDELADRLDDAYRLLTTSRRGAPQRQRTLLALVESSFVLCTPDERLLWARLAVFTGRFTLDAVEDVCSGGAIERDAVLDLVSGLLDQSVLTKDEHLGGSWYRLPRLLREYGAGRLAELGEAEEHLRDRHVDWCLRLARRAEEGLLGERSDFWAAQIRGNDGNFRAALGYSLTVPDRVDDALRLSAALWYHWIIAGRIGEGRAWLDRAVRACPSPGVAYARALAAAAYLAVVDDDPEAEHLLKRAQVLDEGLAPPELSGELLFVEGLLAVHRGNFRSAIGRLEGALTSMRTAGYVMGISRTLSLLALACALDGDAEKGLRYCEEFLEMPNTAGQNWGRAYIHMNVALVRSAGGDHAGAWKELREFAESVRRFDDRFAMSWCVHAGALISAASGRHQQAALLIGAGINHRDASFIATSGLRERAASLARAALGDETFERVVEEGRALTLRAATEVLAGPSPAPEAAEDEVGVPALSRREWEVAELIADGRTNKEIAAALVISTRTAEGHVRRILGKLDFLSRAQIAAWMTERRAVTRRSATRPSPIAR